MSAVASPRDEHVLPAIAAHFEGRISVSTEALMRAHLPACPTCREAYQRHLIVAELDPQAISGQDRLGKALGFRMKPRRPWVRWLVGVAVPVAAAASFALLSVGGDGEFTERGSHGPAPRVWVYRVAEPAVPRLVERSIAARDEVAFAYSNPGGEPYLMVFGVDEHRHVYWFHPAWPEGQPAPRALAAAAGPGPHELPGAIRQALDGRHLQMYGLFSRTQLDASTVESLVTSTAAGEPLSGLGPGVVITRSSVEVTP